MGHLDIGCVHQPSIHVTSSFKTNVKSKAKSKNVSMKPKVLDSQLKDIKKPKFKKYKLGKILFF